MRHFFGQLNSGLNRSLAVLASCSLLAMMLLTVGEMVLRMLGTPLAGIVEVIGWLSAATAASALGYTQLHKGHVAISLLTDRFSQRVQAALGFLVNLTSTVLFAFAAWHVFEYGRSLRDAGSLSETLKVIEYPWVYLVAAGCAGLALAILVDFLDSCRSLFTGHEGSR